jgi:hypothetical protein
MVSNVCVASLLAVEPNSAWLPKSAASFAGGVAIIVLECVFLGLFLLSVGTAWFLAIWHGPFWQPFGDPIPITSRIAAVFRFLLAPTNRPVSFLIRCHDTIAAPSRWQQVDRVTAWVEPWEDRSVVPAVALRPNVCTATRSRCANGIYGRRDRMYHAEFPHVFTYGSCCLPAWDHYCPWIMAPVYLHTIKPYVLALWYLVLYALFLTSVMIYQASRGLPSIWTIAGVPLAIISVGVVIKLSGKWGYTQVKWLVLANETLHERRNRDVVRMFARPTGDGHWVIKSTIMNPWDQGTMYANLVHTMGDRWYHWLCPLSVPRRVRDYDDQRRPDFDEQFGPAFLDWLRMREQADAMSSEGHLPQTHLSQETRAAFDGLARRHQGRSTGVDYP